MIILGPPLESREPTTPPLFYNVEEFTRICLSMYSLCPFRAEERSKSCPSTHARNFCVSLFPFFPVCVCVFVYLLLPRPMFRSPISRRRIFDCSTVCDFLWFFLVSCFPMDILPYVSASCRLLGPPDTLPFLHAVDVDLKVGRFLVSLIPEKSMQTIRTIRDICRNMFETQEVI